MSEKGGVIPRPRLVLVMALGLWATIVVLFATQFVLVGSFAWGDAFQHAGWFWCIWAVFMPLVVWWSFKYPLERARLWRHVGMHVIACALIVSVSQVVYRNFRLMPPPPRNEVSQERDERAELRSEDERGHRRPDGFVGLRAGVDILVFWSLVSVCQAVIHFRKSEQRERRAAELQARLTRSQLQSLRMQINPHFLFNTLNAISTLVHLNPKAADEMITDLSDLLRTSLDSADEQEVPLASELDFIRRYAGIERKRFGDRLRVEQKVPLELMEAMVPSLILQPLVENAIRHGIEPRKEPGVITISAQRQPDGLHLVVSDNGRGVAAEPSKGTRRGIGLSNTQARLQELYGAAHSFSFGNAAPRGCEVRIRIPYHTRPLGTVAKPKELPA